MLNLNDLRVYERVAVLGSFSAASRSLGQPKSSVSRGVRRLETQLGVRLLQRTTRRVVLTPAGAAMRDRCAGLLVGLRDALDHVGSIGGSPRGMLKLSVGIGFGIKVLSEQLPGFLARYPEINVSLDLSSKLGNPVSDGVDVAIRIGALSDSESICVTLGSMKRYLCGAPSYLKRRGEPRTVMDVASHDVIEMPRGDGRTAHWTFQRGDEIQQVELQPRVVVNEALTILRLVQNGVGLGIVSAYLCGPLFKCGALIRLFPEWASPPVEVNLVFPGHREAAPIVRAFVDYMKEVTLPGKLWLEGI